MTDQEKLLAIAEKLGIPLAPTFHPDIPENFISLDENAYYYEHNELWRSFLWSLTGPDAGNTMLVIMESFSSKNGWVIEQNYNPVTEKYFCKILSFENPELKGSSFSDRASEALLEAAAKALGVEG